MSKNSRRRNRLFGRDATCHWCGVDVVYVHAERWARGDMPPNFATLDHLDDRLSCPDRGRRLPAQEERTVLACLACNLRRNREQQRANGKHPVPEQNGGAAGMRTAGAHAGSPSVGVKYLLTPLAGIEMDMARRYHAPVRPPARALAGGTYAWSTAMDAANPFAQTPLTPEPIIAQVSRQLRVKAADGSPDANRLVEGLVDRVVRDLWSSRVKTFVPILALRETRDLLREVRLAEVREHAEAPATDVDLAVRPEQRAVQLGGSVAIGRDALSIDWRDALRVDDEVLPL